MACDRDRSQDMTPPIPLPTRPHFHIVEQVPYRCGTLQNGWTALHESIEFKVKGLEGINLIDAMNERFDGPDGRDDNMFTDDRIGNSISCRIEVRGFCDSDFCYHSTTPFDQLKGYSEYSKPRQVPPIHLLCSSVM